VEKRYELMSGLGGTLGRNGNTDPAPERGSESTGTAPERDDERIGGACPIPPSDTEETPDRRAFLGWVAGASIGATALFSTAMVSTAVMPPDRSIEGKTKVGRLAVGRVDELEVEQPVLAEYGDDVLYLIKKSDEEINVFDAACPHVACKLSWNPDTSEFDCPCHASAFDIDGTLLYGPAPRDMYAAEFEIEDGEIVVSSIIRT
jgi:Rieske Fe-S protein